MAKEQRINVKPTQNLIIVCLPQRAPLAPLWPLWAPTWTTPSSITRSRASLLSIFFQEELSFPFFCSCVPVFYMYEHVVGIYTAHITAWRNQPCTKQQKQVRADQMLQRERRVKLTHMFVFICESVGAQASFLPIRRRDNDKKTFILKLTGVMREESTLFPISIRDNTALSLRPFYFVHACGVRVLTLEHGALGICKWPVST